MGYFEDMSALRAFAQEGEGYPLTDEQLRMGLAFLGDSNPPLELHNELWKRADQKINWIYETLNVLRFDNRLVAPGPIEVLPPEPEFTASDHGTISRALGLNRRLYTPEAGYHTFPGGFMVQWGIVGAPVTNAPAASVTFNNPISFRKLALGGVATAAQVANTSGNTWPAASMANVGQSQTTVVIDTLSGVPINRVVPVRFVIFGA